MITARVSALDDFGRVLEHVAQASRRALNEAAREGASTFEQRSAGINGASATIIPAHGTADGWASGIRIAGPLWRIFDKGTLGHHVGRLKKGRKSSWQVRRGDTEYTAERGEVEGKGIAPRNISNPARTVGRKALLRAIRNR